MSTLHIEEYSTVLKDINGDLADVPHINTARTQLTYTSTSVKTSFNFDSKTSYIIIHADIDSYILLGDSSVIADQNSILLPANTFRSFGLPGGVTRIAVITKT